MDDKEKMLIMAKLMRGAMGGDGAAQADGQFGANGGEGMLGNFMSVGIEELERRREEEERERLAQMIGRQ